ncbi:MAG: PH domain-containing protein [Candidatus Woykebacteria bacterium]
MQAQDYRNLRFEGEDKQEETLFFLRPHAIINVGWVLVAVFLLILSTGVVAFLPNNQFFELPLEPTTVYLSILVFDLVIAGGAFQWFLHWYFNIYVLTNKRLVDIDFFGLFHRKISQTTLRNVEDVTYSKHGVLQNFFDFGDVHIQTAGTLPNFEFHAIPDPEGSVQQILNLVAKYKGGVAGHHEPRSYQPTQ